MNGSEFRFNKLSQKVFDEKDVTAWLFAEDGKLLVDVLEKASEDNECSTAHYEVYPIAYKYFEFKLVRSWGEKTLPDLITGETEFRNFIKRL